MHKLATEAYEASLVEVLEDLSMSSTRSNHLAAANRRFSFASGALSWFDNSIYARRQLPAPVAERDRSVKALPTVIAVVLLLCGCNSTDKAGDALLRAKSYAQKGEFEKALKEHVWFHNNALQVDRSYYGVRLSFALNEWVELGRKYPKALEELKNIRDKKASLLAGGATNPELFHDVEAINEHLGDTRSTALLFKQIEARDSTFAGSLYEVAEESLIAAGEYPLARKYLGDPQERFATATNNFERGLAFAAKQSQNGDVARKATEEIFSERVVRLVTVLAKTGDSPGARGIQTEALRLLDNGAIKNAQVQ